VAGQPVQLQRAAPTGPKEVPTYRTIASTATGPDGRFGFGVPAAQGGRIRIQFPTTTAYPSLASPSPIAVGSLHETQLDVGHIEVQSRIALRKATVKGRWVRLQGGVAPSSGRSAEASLVIEARKLGAKQFRRIRVAHPSRGASYSVRVKLGQGRWQLRVEYRDLGTVLPASSGQRSVSVTAGS
jgi:hypothetical protein